MEDKLLVFVLGAPGAGKGTQCEMVRKEFGWSHISAGDLLRAQVAAGTEVGKEAEQIMKDGKMVPSGMIIGLLKEALSSAEHSKVLIDGFPRVRDQLGEFEQQVRRCDKAFFFNVAEDIAMERCKLRGENGSGREDDNEDTIHKRFVVFESESMPVVEALRDQGRLVEIDAAAAPEEVYAHTRRVIEELQQQQESATKPEAVETAPAEAEEGAAVTEDLPAAAAVASVEAVAAALSAEVSRADEQAASADAHSPADVIAGVAAKSSAASAAEPAAEASIPTAAPTAEGSTTAAEPADVAAEPSAASAVAAEPAAEATAAAADAAVPVDAAAAVPVEQSSVEQPPAADASSEQPQMEAAQAAAPAVARAEAESPEAAAAAQADSAAVASGQQVLQVDLSGIRTPIVICGPSGVGKGTLINKLMTQYSDRLGFSVSHTTRAPRPGEQHGVHYNFTDIAAMKEQVAAGLFLEHAEVHGNMYGTSLAGVADVSNQGKHCVLDIDVQGAQQVKASPVGHLCYFIFVAPPSYQELERRLRNRGTETEDKVLQRLANAKAEIAKSKEPGCFDHVLVNADLDVAYYELQQLINQKIPGLIPEVESMPRPQPTAPAEAPAAAPSAVSNATSAPAPAFAAPTVANGTTAPAPAAPGGTSTLLDFGFGASAGPAVAVKGMPVRQYMDVTVIPVLREGLKALNAARPDDPLQFLADFLIAHKAATH